MNATVDVTFPRRWRAEILSARPLILPARHFTYPREAEEVERGALEVMVNSEMPNAPGFDLERLETEGSQSFLATCALGFRDPAVPTGIWSCPRPEDLCAVSGGYAYIIDTTAPERFNMVPYRPVLEIRTVAEENLLLFVGNRSILAWGPQGQAWESERLSDEGITISSIENGVLRGMGWQMLTDKETPFELDLRTGAVAGGQILSSPVDDPKCVCS